MQTRKWQPLVGILGAFFSVAVMAAPQYAISLHGSPKYPADFKHFDYVNPNAPKGGTLTEDAVGAFDNLNSFILKGVAPNGMGLIYDTLMVHSVDEPFSIYGLVAETIDIADDHRSVTFVLRAAARFHDGHPITADDVVFTFNTLKEKGHPYYAMYYQAVTKAEALDKKTVRFELADPNNRELPLIIGDLPVLPEHYWKSRDFTQTTRDVPLGSGPYKVGAVDMGKTIVYERVPDYWAKDLPVNVGRHNIATRKIVYFRDRGISLEAFKSGGLDYREENNSKLWATSYDFPAVKQGLVKIENLSHQIPQGIQGFGFNTRKPMFADRRVREALGYAFDFDWSNKNLFYGQYVRNDSYFSNSDLAARSLPSKEELELLAPFKDQLPPEVFTKVYNAPSSKGDGNIRGNLRQAVKLLQSAGWRVKDNQLVNTKTGEKMEFEILLSSPAFERIVIPFVRNLEKLGVKATVRTVDATEYIKRFEKFEYDMSVVRYGQSSTPGNEQKSFWGSAAADINGSRNYMGIKDPIVDQLIDKLIVASTREELVTRTRALDRVLLWNHYLIPHYHITSFRIAYWDKFERPAVRPKYDLGLDTWWVEVERESKINKSRNLSD